MAFNILNFALQSSSGNHAAAYIYCYNTSTDTFATVTASGYFNEISMDLNQYDLIYVVASDTQAWVKVTSASGAATVTTSLVSTFTTGLAEGSILIGDSGNLAAAVSAKTNGDILIGNGTTLVSTNNILSPLQIGNYSNNSGSGTIAGKMVITTLGGATANRDITSTYKIKILGVHVIGRGTGTTSDTIQVLNGTGGASPITEAISIASVTATSNNYLTAATLNDSNTLISAGGTIRVTETDGGGNDSPACSVVIDFVRS